MEPHLSFLQTWYQKQLNGFWEHGRGITIETLATPGWSVTVDLMETPFENATMDPFRRERTDKDWILCEVGQRQFRGLGDPQKLIEILLVFQTWVSKAPA